MADKATENVEQLKTRLEKAIRDFEHFTNNTVKPLAQKGAEVAGQTTQVAKERFYSDVVPAAITAVGTAKAVLEALKEAPVNADVAENVRRGAADLKQSAEQTAAEVKDAAVESVKQTKKAAKKAAKKAKQATHEVSEQVADATEPKKAGAGRWLLPTLGIAAVVGIGVAIVRAVTLADEHWIGIDDEFDDDL
ncbi:hypothetical protein F8O06_00410 [Pseudoclavibacter sp. CFCC 14310]|uniref:hypothetical protein n=1 Tax=Pseudoclavibacter sp. CFCC 14310 TaxID=2615180 RepID=UPI0013019466|nr:hypothetical protein [Pseudoclavibacter sp. CFCC 14310]KAB1647086.1 hypothetical protein F8O06_00410 [Pseudoclavibacter sp. CFCC 14310]